MKKNEDKQRISGDKIEALINLNILSKSLFFKKIEIVTSTKLPDKAKNFNKS